jgi:hypothetical protein
VVASAAIEAFCPRPVVSRRLISTGVQLGFKHEDLIKATEERLEQMMDLKMKNFELALKADISNVEKTLKADIANVGKNMANVEKTGCRK